MTPVPEQTLALQEALEQALDLMRQLGHLEGQHAEAKEQEQVGRARQATLRGERGACEVALPALRAACGRYSREAVEAAIRTNPYLQPNAPALFAKLGVAGSYGSLERAASTTMPPDEEAPPVSHEQPSPSTLSGHTPSLLEAAVPEWADGKAGTQEEADGQLVGFEWETELPPHVSSGDGDGEGGEVSTPPRDETERNAGAGSDDPLAALMRPTFPDAGNGHARRTPVGDAVADLLAELDQELD